MERRKRTVGSVILPWVGVGALLVTMIWNRSAAENTTATTVEALKVLTSDVKVIDIKVNQVMTDVAVGKMERDADRKAVAVATANLAKALDDLTVEMRRVRNEGR